MPATLSNFGSGYQPSAQGLGILPLNEAVDVVVDDTATLLTKPSGRTILVLKAIIGAWTLKVGDHVSSYPTDPSATTTGGTAGNALWELAEGESMVVAAPSELTVKAGNTGDKLKYYWV